MSFKSTVLPVVVVVSEVDRIKETIKALEKDNVNLQYELGTVTLKRGNFKLNLNQKRKQALKADNKVQAKQHKMRKVGEVLKGTYEILFLKRCN